jgi:hypothetical protein
MSDISTRRNKVLVSDIKPGENSKTIVATVTCCLCSHSECSGSYTDTLTGSYVIECVCACHFSERESKK